MHQGVPPRKIRSTPLPSGKGSGAQYVLTQYPRQVEAHRSQAARMASALVVHVDADPQYTVADRHQQLSENLIGAGLPPRGAREEIAHLVPKRNIETWIHFYLDGPPIDEMTEYAKYPEESACWPAAEKFSEDAAQGAPQQDRPPSLVQGLQEFQRVQGR
jgi:hypothetical protein